MTCLHLFTALQNVLRSWLWPGHLLDLLLSCSEFSGNGVASEVLVLLIQLLGVPRLARTFCCYLCLRHNSHMSVPYVLFSVFTLCSRLLLCSVWLQLWLCLCSSVASQPPPSILRLLGVAVLLVNSSPSEPDF